MGELHVHDAHRFKTEISGLDFSYGIPTQNPNGAMYVQKRSENFLSVVEKCDQLGHRIGTVRLLGNGVPCAGAGQQPGDEVTRVCEMVSPWCLQPTWRQPRRRCMHGRT
jgi:hypothetical protein